MNTLEEIESEKLQKIVAAYNRHRKVCSDYKKIHPELNRVYSNKYYKTMKEEDSERYDAYLAKQKEVYIKSKATPEAQAKRKEYYEEIVKPKNQILKQEKALAKSIII
jgi:hypothetical protein